MVLSHTMRLPEDSGVIYCKWHHACVVGFEEVVAMGAEKFVLFGSCGVLDDDKVKDNIIIPVSAVRDEGTSYHYLPPSREIEADACSVQVLADVLTKCGYSYIKGKTWTSDDIYRISIWGR